MDEQREPIGHLEQWRLLVDVCRIFACEHVWTARGANKLDALVVQEQAELFKVNIKEIGVHIPTDLVLGSDARDEFKLAIEALLSSLESLVDDTKLPVKEKASADSSYVGPLDRFPKLVALKTMLDRGDSPSLEYFGHYLHLFQDAWSFKGTRFAVQTFHHTSARVLSGDAGSAPVQAASAKSSTLAPVFQPQSSFSHSFWNGSKRLFDHLVQNVQACDEKNAIKQAVTTEHKLLLRLKHFQDYYERDGMSPRVGILLASCSEQKSWHQTICSISSQR
jgi:hypothetical protein